ncbi:alpha/beta hydrolase [Amorphoplanes nipponensis]|uniref:Hydrolase n=1 Tax=Actinoplanes nipponensis TaxID=135950 RepID=A0A919MLU3_9ACTN|nr:alpha/beta hydrolase [Actinoplanes nipponensis]GIE46728.1 hydrolase [Actinoplanes nipponensis]
MTMISATADTLAVPGARLHYEVRGAGPLVLLTGAPMDARSFEGLAGLLARDHTVLTTDPRGINRSPVEHPDRDSTPVQRAEDLACLLTHLDAGPAVVLGSSGGAVSALALVQSRPDLVHTVIAHEPPLEELLEDREQLAAATEDMIATYLAGDVAGAWRKFLAAADIDLPPGAIEQMFLSDRSPRTVADEHFQFAHMLRATARWVPDLDRLRSVPTRIVVGIGEDSAGQLCDRASRALAAGLGVTPTLFPGDHIGFVDRPAAFEVRLRAVLER